MGLLAILLGQVLLKIAAFVDRTTLVDELLAKAIPERLDEAAAAVSDEDNSAAKYKATPLQILEKLFA
mgnify:CR=1 FL=1